MTERERFSAYILEKYNSDVVWHEGNPIKAMDSMLWQTWQAATQREGFKFVPVEIKDRKKWCKLLNTHDRDLDERHKAMIGVVDE